MTFTRSLQSPVIGDEASLGSYVAPLVWAHPGLDELLAEIAAWKEQALWASVTTGEVFAANDGGVDLIVRDRARRAALVHEHAAWRSKHPRGL